MYEDELRADWYRVRPVVWLACWLVLKSNKLGEHTSAEKSGLHCVARKSR